MPVGRSHFFAFFIILPLQCVLGMPLPCYGTWSYDRGGYLIFFLARCVVVCMRQAGTQGLMTLFLGDLAGGSLASLT